VVLRLYRSNRAERLCDVLAEVVRVPLADPFAADRIVVQSKGMERWLAMELSRRLGVWANPRCPFPRHLIDGVFRAVFGPADEGGSPFDEGILTWAIAQRLPEHLADPAFAPIARYLDADEPEARTIDLAERIAGVFDDYVVYRPEMALAWERGEGRDWQAVLFRDLVARHGPAHQAARARAFIERLRSADAIDVRLPERISVFGIATLPRLHLSVLAALAQRIDVHLFLLAATREYFGDLRRRLPVMEEASVVAGASGEPPLLASFVRLGREFQDLLEDTEVAYDESGADLFVDPGCDSALATLQSDMLHLRRRGQGGVAPPRALAADDRSISIHACHGPMREVEVLHDQLVDLLHDGRVRPDEVIVLTPDIETYAPYVDAVFGVATGRPAIPYACVRRRAGAAEAVVDAFGTILDVLSGRMEASQVLDLLGSDAIRARFGIAASELDTVRQWVAESGIRWGEDAAHRQEVGQPGFHENTWRFGLERMLLGHAVAGDGVTLFEGRLPYTGVAGGDAALAGKLADLCERLFAYRRAFAAPRPIAEWRVALGGLLETMIERGPDTAHQHQSVREALDALARHAERVQFAVPVDLATFRRRLGAVLDDALPARGFLAGGVTFCQLVPMRAIPFRIVCLLGMNDEGFPRRSTTLGFDRIASEPAPGDRSEREDDRHAFLEALLSARERVVITYVGQGVQDNRVIPPSVVVHELLDTLRESFTVPEGTTIEDHVVVRHRLQGFSPAYFHAPATSSDVRLFSYARHYFEGARAFGATRHDPPFLAQRVCDPEPAIEMSLEEFESYVTQPARAFVRRRLGLILGEELVEIGDREPIDLGPLDGWKLGDEALANLLAGKSLIDVHRALHAGGGVPLGTPGGIALGELDRPVGAIAEKARKWRAGKRHDPVDVSFEVDGLRVRGVVRDLWERAHVHVAFSKTGGRFELVHWLRHLLLHHARASRPGLPVPDTSVVVARDRRSPDAAVEITFGPVTAPMVHLRELVRFVRAARAEPIPFFRNASRAYADVCLDGGGDAGRGLAEAAEAFDQWDDDPHDRLCFPTFARATAPREHLGFEAAAKLVYDPFFEHRGDA
jgi:exodeoxyribonuclease V gamma subunit